MKKKQFEAIGKQLLTVFPGFHAKGKFISATPIDHTLRAICFDESIKAKRFYVQVFFQPLFVPKAVIAFNLGWRLGGGSHTWDADAPTLIDELGDSLRRDALPFLSRVRSPLDVAKVGESLRRSGDVRVREAIAYAYARAGERKKAILALDKFVKSVDVLFPWQQEMVDDARALRSVVESDPDEARKQLQEREVGTAKRIGLEGFL